MHRAIASAIAVGPASWSCSRRARCALSWIRTAVFAITVASPITALQISSGTARGLPVTANASPGPAGMAAAAVPAAASPGARAAVLKMHGWSLLDQRDLRQLVRDLPLHRARTLLEQFWDPAVRRAFLPVAGIDAFLGLDEHFAPTLDMLELDALGPTEVWLRGIPPGSSGRKRAGSQNPARVGIRIRARMPILTPTVARVPRHPW